MKTPGYLLARYTVTDAAATDGELIGPTSNPQRIDQVYAYSSAVTGSEALVLILKVRSEGEDNAIGRIVITATAPVGRWPMSDYSDASITLIPGDTLRLEKSATSIIGWPGVDITGEQLTPSGVPITVDTTPAARVLNVSVFGAPIEEDKSESVT